MTVQSFSIHVFVYSYLYSVSMRQEIPIADKYELFDLLLWNYSNKTRMHAFVQLPNRQVEQTLKFVGKPRFCVNHFLVAYDVGVRKRHSTIWITGLCAFSNNAYYVWMAILKMTPVLKYRHIAVTVESLWPKQRLFYITNILFLSLLNLFYEIACILNGLALSVIN